MILTEVLSDTMQMMGVLPHPLVNLPVDPWVEPVVPLVVLNMPAKFLTTPLHPLKFLIRRRTLIVSVRMQFTPLSPVVQPVLKLRMTAQLVLPARVELVVRAMSIMAVLVVPVMSPVPMALGASLFREVATIMAALFS